MSRWSNRQCFAGTKYYGGDLDDQGRTLDRLEGTLPEAHNFRVHSFGQADVDDQHMIICMMDDLVERSNHVSMTTAR